MPYERSLNGELLHVQRQAAAHLSPLGPNSPEPCVAASPSIGRERRDPARRNLSLVSLGSKNSVCTHSPATTIRANAGLSGVSQLDDEFGSSLAIRSKAD